MSFSISCRGVIFYKDSNEVVVGILLWNIFNKMSIARRIISEHKKFDDIVDVSNLFQMYKDPFEEEEEDVEKSEEMEKK